MNDNAVANKEVCGFCGRGVFQLRRLVVGESASICDKCVLECVDAMLTKAETVKLPNRNVDSWDWPTGVQR